MEKIAQLVKLACLLVILAFSGIQATSLAARLTVINCSAGLACNEGVLNAVYINDFALANDRSFSETAIGHPFLNIDDRKVANFLSPYSIYDADPIFNNLADDVPFEVSLTVNDYAEVVGDASVGFARKSYTESLIASSISPTVLLLGSGLLGLVVVTRRRRNNIMNTFASD
ncbi:hypothetical protein MNBD_GAMMA16-2088 [hydrothermal vent metagenome]|uniref:Uncharacterized protein n=1 Tax=hydrothermal vent metagenome TaxID=652676 RepID=A0A3B0ZLM7_9ZZZZ